MKEHARSTEARVQVWRIANRAEWGRFFSSEIPGNRVANVGIVDLGAERLQVILAETDGGATFPAQFHTSSRELAVIIAGVGAIEVGEDRTPSERYDVIAGDVVLIPPQFVYRVCNRHASEPLMAWVFCAEETQFYWPDGSRV